MLTAIGQDLQEYDDRLKGQEKLKSIIKFLKPFMPIVIICILFLTVRAYTDLSLPNLMSDIVNNGIQRSGITESQPQKISADGMELIQLYMTAEERALINENYRYEADGELFVFIGDARDETVGNAYGRAVFAMVQSLGDFKELLTEAAQEIYTQSGGLMVVDLSGMEQMGGASEAAQEGDASAIDITQFYELIPLLKALPEGRLSGYAPSVEPTLSRQVGAVFTKMFYQELGPAYGLDTAKIQRDYIWAAGGKMLLITLFGVMAHVAGGYCASRVGAAFSRDMRRAVFAKVESFSSKEFDKFSTASLLTRTTNDVNQIQMIVIMSLRFLLYAPIMGVGGSIMAINKSTSLSWIIALAVVIMIGVIMVIYSMIVPKFTKIQTLTDRLNLISRDHLAGMLVIRAFGNEEYEENRFDEVNLDYTQTNRSLQRMMAVMGPMMTIFMNAVTVTIVWVGAHSIANSSLLIGDMMAFMQYGMQILMSFVMVAMMFIMIPRAAVSIRRIDEVLASEMIIVEKSGPRTLAPSAARTVAFNNVTFRYGRAKEPVLRNVSFVAEPGKTTAIIGATGAGKSALASLIPRFYDVTEGSVTVDGIDVRDLAFEELRGNIAYVPQKGMLFSGTVADNLRYGRKDAGEQEINTALEVAQAAEFVSELEGGIEHEIAQGGTDVSGGQRQRLAIARAIIRRAPIAIFDDSFSALDFKTDAALRRALKQYTSNATVIIVAQRISTIMQADQIIVLDNGELVGKGTHRELLKTCQTYREIAESQLAKEEMA